MGWRIYRYSHGYRASKPGKGWMQVPGGVGGVIDGILCREGLKEEFQ
jgi:hypothetical protein